MYWGVWLAGNVNFYGYGSIVFDGPANCCWVCRKSSNNMIGIRAGCNDAINGPSDLYANGALWGVSTEWDMCGCDPMGTPVSDGDCVVPPDCHGCNSVHWTEYNSSGIGQSYVLNGPFTSVGPWTMGVPYSFKDIVSFESCCWVLVHHPTLTVSTVDPATAYTDYVNSGELAGLVSWVPCDHSCVTENCADCLARGIVSWDWNSGSGTGGNETTLLVAIQGIWNPGGTYTAGNIVHYTDPVTQDECCYVWVNKYFDSQQLQSFIPAGYYDSTIDPNTNATTWYGLYGSFANTVKTVSWVPCEEDCIQVNIICWECVSQTQFYETADHIGTYIVDGIMGWNSSAQWYWGTWTLGIGGSVYDKSFVTDPIDGCCYFLAHDFIHNYPASPIWLYPPSQCYNNHIQGFYCDGSTHYINNPMVVQKRFPVWWPCDTGCTTTGPAICSHCDTTTPVYDPAIASSNGYTGGDLVLYACDFPTLPPGSPQYCCYENCGPSTSCVGASYNGTLEPGDPGAFEYWQILCGADCNQFATGAWLSPTQLAAIGC